MILPRYCLPRAVRRTTMTNTWSTLRLRAPSQDAESGDYAATRSFGANPNAASCELPAERVADMGGGCASADRESGGLLQADGDLHLATVKNGVELSGLAG